MTEQEFLALGRAGYNRIPLQLETLADLDTPLSIYLKLANRPGSYLLESVIGGERFGRYSIVGLPARERLEVSGHKVSLTRDGGSYEQKVVDDPLEFIDEYLRSFRAAPPCASLRFAGGLAGYFGYDTVRYIEGRLKRAAKPDPLGLPSIRKAQRIGFRRALQAPLDVAHRVVAEVSREAAGEAQRRAGRRGAERSKVFVDE